MVIADYAVVVVSLPKSALEGCPSVFFDATGIFDGGLGFESADDFAEFGYG